MKHLVLVAFTLFSMAALAQQGRPQIPPGTIPGHDQIPPHPPGGWPDDNHDGGWGGGHHGGGHSSCAPEVVEGNVAATGRTLSALAASPEFAQATQFQTTVSNIAAVRSDDVKVARYFALIGIDSNDANAVADFVGAREVRASWLSSLERTTGLSSAQADVVASKLQIALRGDLR